MRKSFKVKTDTATLCVYDLSALRHRLNDWADWWTMPEDLDPELAAGKAMFVDVGEDGIYEIELEVEDRPRALPAPGSVIRCASGRVYVGIADSTTSEQLEPDGTGGAMLDLRPGRWRVVVQRLSVRSIRILLAAAAADDVLGTGTMLRV